MTEEVVREPFPGLVLERVFRAEQPAEIFALDWAPDGQVLATGAKDMKVRLWGPRGQPIAALDGHRGTVLSVAFSPDGARLASGSVDHSIRIWELGILRSVVHELKGHTERVTGVAWSRDGSLLVSGSDDHTVRCWSTIELTEMEVLRGHAAAVNAVAVSPVAQVAASASFDGTVRLWSIGPLGSQTRSTAYTRFRMYRPEARVLEHPGAVHSVRFSPDGKLVATGCADAAIRIWDVESAALVRILEGHSTAIRALACSPDGRFLVSKSDAGSVRVWRCDRWQQLGLRFEVTTSQILSFGISRDNLLATFAEDQHAVSLWRLDPQVLLAGSAVREQYCNAKVVLVGDSGVGKSGLALALAGKPFSPTESTHGRHVWQLDERVEEVAPDLREAREILLWDLAGQPAYRIVHQLHLHDTTVAIIVFDARNDTDPLAGVHHWDRALRQARRGQVGGDAPLHKVLVVARVDRGGVGLGAARLAQLRAELGIGDEDFFETSAKEGWGVAELREALDRHIDWAHLPKVTSTRLFHDIKSFVAGARGRTQRLLTVSALCDAFLSQAGPAYGDVRAQLETCVGRLESRGLVRRLTFGNYVLLEPELLDSYASAIVEAARDEPDGLGIIAEDDVRAGRFRMPAGRLADPHEEEILLIATIEALVRGEIALREVTDRGVVLVFPAQSTREAPPEVVRLRPSRRVGFEGSARSVYATLAVRLANSGVFQRGEIWRDGLLVTDALGVPCGVRLTGMTEVGGELEVLVSPRTAPAIRAQLEQFVHGHALKRAIAATVRAEPVLTCACGEVFPPGQIQKCLERNKRWITCPVCDDRTPLGEGADDAAALDDVDVMDRDADARRERDAASVSLQGKERARDFDVFLCHNSRDKAEVKAIGRELKARGYLPWLDEWELPPGQPWQPELEAQLTSIRAAAVFIGGDGAGPWQNVELRALLSQFVERGCPVIPVILPSVADPAPKLPTFLQSFTWVDYRLDDPQPLDRLIWGITRSKPRGSQSEL